MVWLQTLLLHILGYDLWFYVSHRALHSALLGAMHRNHEKQFPHWSDTYHGSWVETVGQSVGFVLPWACYFWSWPATLIACLFINLRGMARHDPRTMTWIGNHHLLHHQFPTWNYGEPWLDLLFGTSCPYQNRIVEGRICS
jgi:sterol desaturase/sphingolipid hydroxylase (fatty acid hydroxylase superfamily)